PMSYGGAQKLADHLKVAKTKDELRVLDLAAGSGIWGIALAEKSPRVASGRNRLGRNDSHDQTYHAKVWRQRSIQIYWRRSVGSRFWQRLRCRDAGPYFAQRRRTTQPAIAQKNL